MDQLRFTNSFRSVQISIRRVYDVCNMKECAVVRKRRRDAPSPFSMLIKGIAARHVAESFEQKV